MMAIAEMMAADNEPAPGIAWTVDVVKFILKNRNYTGDFVWGDRKSGKYNFATDEPIELPNNHAIIVSPQAFDAIQKRRAQQSGGKTPQPNGGSFVLSGLLKCDECGSPMYGHNVKGNAYLLCSGYLSRGRNYCSRNSVREDVVLDHVIGAIEDTYLNPKTISDLRTELRRQVEKRPIQADCSKLRKQLAKIEKDLSTTRRNMALADLELRPEYEQIFRELKSQQRLLTAEIKAASVPQKDRLAEQDQKVDRAMQLFSQLRSSLLNADTVKLREFLRTAIDKIIIRVAKTRQGRRDSYRLLGGDIHMQVYDLGITAR